MGWLRDAWRDAGFRSADELAGRILKTRSWPAARDKIGKRSLGNNLRALDRGQRLAWWRAEDDILLYVLAGQLGRDPQDVIRELVHKRRERELVERGPGPAPLARFGKLRPLDLERERLPPGIPELIRRPARWERVWWCSRSTPLRRLVGRWLAARDHAAYLEAESWSEANQRLPTRGRVFVNLTRPHPAIEVSAAAVALEGLRVCVAAPYPVNGGELAPIPGSGFPWHQSKRCARSESVWVSVVLDPVDRWLEELVAWGLARVPKKRRPELSAVLEALGPSGVTRFLSGPGDVLDFLGLFVAVGKRGRPGARDFENWARRWIGALVALGGDNDGKVGLIDDRADGIVASLLGQLLLEGAAPWNDGWTRSRWASKLPRESVPGADVASLRSLVVEPDKGLTPEQARQLQRALQPRSADVIAALRTVGVLVERANRRFSPRACWAVEALYTASIGRALDRAEPRTLGRLAVEPYLGGAVVSHLFERLVAGVDRSIRAVLQEPSIRTGGPLELAALEACVCALGLARLIVDVDPALMNAAWGALRHIVIRGADDLVLAAVPLGDSEARRGLGARPVFALAVLSRLDACAPESLAGEELESLITNASGAAAIVERARPGRGLADAAFRLGGRVLAARATADWSKFLESDLLVPARLYEFIPPDGGKARVADELFDELASVPSRSMSPERLLSALESMDGLFDVAFGNLMKGLWTRWGRQGPEANPPPLSWLESSPDAAAKLWSYCERSPGQAFFALFVEQRRWPEPVRRNLSADAWRGWIETGFTLEPDRFGCDLEFEAFWALVPRPIVAAFAVRPGSSPELNRLVLERAWRLSPDELFRAIERRPAPLSAGLLSSAPIACSDRLLAIVAGRAEEIRSSSFTRAHTLRWLQGVMSKRPGALDELMMVQRMLLTGE